MAKVVPDKMTVDEFERHYAGKPVELIRGEVHETMPAGEEHGEVAARIGVRAGFYALENQLGKVYIAEPGFVLSTSKGQSVRAPDFAFTRKERAPKSRSRQFSRTVPDLVLEVISPTDTPEAVQDKVQEWLEAGVQLVWVADPVQRTVLVYRADGTHETLTVNDTLAGEPVLPGFRLPLREVFE
ncbi:MAG: Uma2 family endonuclease [Fimbriimonadales bacterium]